MPVIAGFEQCDRPEYLLWFDGEYTGLDPHNDLVLEIGFVATDFSLNVLDRYSSFVNHDEPEIRRLMARNEWWTSREKEANEIIEGCTEGVPIAEIDLIISGMTKKITDDKLGILAGNSLTTDRGFISANLPNFASLLHYRMLDVSSFKIFAQSKYGLVFRKALKHRAMEDVNESIAEFRALTQLMNL